MAILRRTGLLWALALGMFVVMMALEWLLFRRLSGGLPSLDLRFAGFTAQEGAAWLAALGPDGAWSVRMWHYLSFDLVFPALLGLAMASTIDRLASRQPRYAAMRNWGRAAFSLCFVAPFVLFDYAQNWVVAALLAHPLEATPTDIERASSLVVAKFVFLMLPIMIIALFALATLRNRTARR